MFILYFTESTLDCKQLKFACLLRNVSKVKDIAVIMGGFLGKSFFNLGEKEELRHENEKLKEEIAMIKQNAERANEEQRASNVEAASLKEELTLTKDALEGQKRLNRLMHERGLAQLQQVKWFGILCFDTQFFPGY